MSVEERWVSHSVAETIALGEGIAARLRGGDVVTLSGELGSGKTHFVKGVCGGLGYDGVVSSPTFALINEYPCTPTIFHVDLYRLESPAQLRPLGLEELMRPDTIVLIEWPAVAAAIVPERCWRIDCACGDSENERIFHVMAPDDTRN